MKTKKTLLKELKQELRYWQSRYRVDLLSLRSTGRKVKEIADKMRKVQHGI